MAFSGKAIDIASAYISGQLHVWVLTRDDATGRVYHTSNAAAATVSWSEVKNFAFTGLSDDKAARIAVNSTGDLILVGWNTTDGVYALQYSGGAWTASGVVGDSTSGKEAIGIEIGIAVDAATAVCPGWSTADNCYKLYFSSGGGAWSAVSGSENNFGELLPNAVVVDGAGDLYVSAVGTLEEIDSFTVTFDAGGHEGYSHASAPAGNSAINPVAEDGSNAAQMLLGSGATYNALEVTIEIPVDGTGAIPDLTFLSSQFDGYGDHTDAATDTVEAVLGVHTGDFSGGGSWGSVPVSIEEYGIDFWFAYGWFNNAGVVGNGWKATIYKSNPTAINNIDFRLDNVTVTFEPHVFDRGYLWSVEAYAGAAIWTDVRPEQNTENQAAKNRYGLAIDPTDRSRLALITSSRTGPSRIWVTDDFGATWGDCGATLHTMIKVAGSTFIIGGLALYGTTEGNPKIITSKVGNFIEAVGNPAGFEAIEVVLDD